MEKKHSILLVEDDRVDVMAVKRSLKKNDIENPLHVAGNGEEALVFLGDPSHAKPGLILLDLNMPKMNGLDFLKVIKNDSDLKKIPVVILTTSKNDEDRLESFNLSVAGYMVKPAIHNQLVEVLKTIHTYWMLSEISQ